MYCNDLTRVWVDPKTNVQYDDPSLLPESLRGTDPSFVFGPARVWGGGDRPVDPDCIVRCIFRGRAPYIGTAQYSGHSETAANSMWRHAPAPGRNDPNADIVAYQVLVK